MRFGICTSLDHAVYAAEAGCDYIESIAATLVPAQDEVAFAPIREQILASPVPLEVLNVFIPGEIKITGPSVDLPALQIYMDTLMRRAKEVGVSVIVFGSGGARSAPEGFAVEQAREQFVDVVRMAGDTAMKYGLTITVEPIHAGGCNILNRVEQGMVIVDRLNHPNVKLLADLFHMTKVGEPFANIVAAAGRFGHIHTGTPSLPETAEGEQLDFREFLDAVVKAGYDGRISVEDNNGLFQWKQLPLTAGFRAAIEYVKAQLPVKA